MRGGAQTVLSSFVLPCPESKNPSTPALTAAPLTARRFLSFHCPLSLSSHQTPRPPVPRSLRRPPLLPRPVCPVQWYSFVALPQPPGTPNNNETDSSLWTLCPRPEQLQLHFAAPPTLFLDCWPPYNSCSFHPSPPLVVPSFLPSFDPRAQQHPAISRCTTTSCRFMHSAP